MSMRWRNRSTLRWLCTSLGLLAGVCLIASTSCRRAIDKTSQAPAPALKTPRALDVLAGKVPLEAVGEGVAVRVDGKPGPTLKAGRGQLDTRTLEDGLRVLTLVRSGASSPIATVPVVVLNGGSEVFFKNGSDGKITVPLGGYQDQHHRHHWDMPDGVKKVLAVLTWPGNGFELELAVGTGTCPHHGTRIAHTQGVRSPLSLVYEPPNGKSADLTQWFAHVRLLNPEKVAGQETAFTVRAFLFR
jgi:hypothetical protein